MPLALPLAYWQLASAGMLVFAAAAAIPLVIHLLSKWRSREVKFAAMEFLIAAARKHSRRILLEQWLLLAVRTLVLLLLALAVANPLFVGLGTDRSESDGTRQLTILVVDSSFSMLTRDAISAAATPGESPDAIAPAAPLFTAYGKSRLEEAQRRMLSVIESSRQGDGFLLVQMADPPRATIGQVSFDASDVAEEVSNLEMLHGGADLRATLALVETLLEEAVRSHPRLTSRRVLLFTDLGRSTWSDTNSREISGKLKEISSSSAVSLIELGSRETGNLAMTSLLPSEPIATTSRPFTIDAELQNFSPDDVSNRLLQLKVDGNIVAEQSLSIEANSKASASFTTSIAAPGEHLIEVHLADDALAIDNTRSLSMRVRSSVSVLLVGSRAASTRSLAIALAPELLTGSDVQVTEILESTLAEQTLSQYDCVMLAEVATITSSEAKMLADYVEPGGGLVVLLGSDTNIASYNQELLETIPLLPAKLEGPSSAGEFRVDPLDYLHPITAPFRGHDRSGLLTIPIWRHQKLLLRPSAIAAVGLSDGTPMLVEGAYGTGRVILSAIAASSDTIDSELDPPGPWSAWSSWPSFPPLVHRILDVAITPQLVARNALVGEDLSGEIPPEVATSEIEITLPDGSEQRVTATNVARQPRWQFAAPLLSGPYEVDFVGGNPLLKQVIAVNVDTRESDLTRIDAASLPREIQPSDASVSLQQESLRRQNTPAFRWILSSLLGLLITESLIAWKLGKGTRR